MSDDAALAAVVAAMWERNADRIRARLAAVLAEVEVLASGGQPDQRGQQDAHVLAGVLGTYGRPGSELLRRTEQALADGAATEAPALAKDLRALATELDQ